MKFVIPEHLPWQELKEGVRLRASWGHDIMVTLTEIAPGVEIPEHSHPHEQVGTILRGAAQVTIDGETRVVEEGQLYFIDHYEKHSIRAMEGGALIQDVFYPIREEFRRPDTAKAHYFPKYFPSKWK